MARWQRQDRRERRARAPGPVRAALAPRAARRGPKPAAASAAAALARAALGRAALAAVVLAASAGTAAAGAPAPGASAPAPPPPGVLSAAVTAAPAPGSPAPAARASAPPAAVAAGARLDSLVESVRFVVEGGGPAAAAATRCRDALRRRAASLAAALLPPGAAPRPVVCHVLPTAAFRERFAGGVPDWGLAVALRGGRVIAIDWERQGANRRPLEEVFCHELAHAWLEQATCGAAVPTWFHEGVALRLSGEWRFIDTVELMLEGRPPPLRRLDGPFPGPAGWADQAYRVSLRAVLALEKQHGRDVIARLAAATGAGGDFAGAFELVTGSTLDAFVAEYDAGWRRGLGWLFTLTRWPGLFILLGLAFLGAGAARRLRLRRLASLEDD